MRKQMLPRKPLPQPGLPDKESSAQGSVSERCGAGEEVIPLVHPGPPEGKDDEFHSSGMSLWLLLRPQGLHGLDFRCADGRQRTGNHRGEQEAAHHSDENNGIEWAGSIRNRAYERSSRRDRQTDRQSKKNRTQAIEQTRRNTSDLCAPSAMRMPISVLRWATRYESTPYRPIAASNRERVERPTPT